MKKRRWEIFIEYQKKYIKRLIAIELLMIIVTVLTVAVDLIQDKNQFSFIYLILIIIMMLIGYIIFVFSSISYIRENMNPYKYKRIMIRDKKSRIILYFAIIIVYITSIYNFGTIKIGFVEEVIKLCWSIFGIIITIMLVRYIVYEEIFSKDREIHSEGEKKLIHNKRVNSSFLIVELILINVLFLSILTMVMYIDLINKALFEYLVTFLLYLTLTIVAIMTYEFLILLIVKYKKILFTEEEIEKERKKLLEKEMLYKNIQIELLMKAPKYINESRKTKKKTEKLLIKLKIITDKYILEISKNKYETEEEKKLMSQMNKINLKIQRNLNILYDSQNIVKEKLSSIKVMNKNLYEEE